MAKVFMKSLSVQFNQPTTIMHETKTLDKFEFDGRFFGIDVTYEFDIENDGIGGYEFWGMRGYDKGTDYAVITDLTLDYVKEELDDGTLVAVDDETRKGLEEALMKVLQDDLDENGFDEDYYTYNDDE